MGLFGFLFGNKSNNIAEFKSRNAIILDVRTQTEYNQGAIPGSKHIPLQHLTKEIEALQKLNRPIITCCASGVRSGRAAALLRSNAIEAINGGNWLSLSKKL